MLNVLSFSSKISNLKHIKKDLGNKSNVFKLNFKFELSQVSEILFFLRRYKDVLDGSEMFE